MMNIIFDFDGCLLDSLEVQKKAYYGSYDEVVGDGKCPSFDEYYKHTGDSITNVFKIMNFPNSMIDAYRRICTENIPLNHLNAEAFNLIDEYKKKNWKFGLCTGKERFRTYDILRYNKLEYLFDAVVCGDDLKEAKPSPLPILKTMELLNANIDNTLYIGDGYNDILAAKAANVKSVLTTWYGDAGVPQEANYTVNSVSELREVLQLFDNLK